MWTRRAAMLGAGAVVLAPRHSEAAVRSRIVPFQTSPFPYDGVVPDSGRPFLDTTDGEQKAHTSPRGGIYKVDPTYGDRSVLLAVPPRFRPAHSAIVLFLHGNLAKLERDVVGRQRIVAQFLASRMNAALVAPQFAVDALDSSAGHFWDPNGFSHFLREAADELGKLTRHSPASFESLPVILVAYSGGHNPAASILSRGDRQRRVRGVLLFDALFDYENVFADWLVHRGGDVFFFSAYSQSSAAHNSDLEDELRTRGISFEEGLPRRVGPGTVAFLDAGIVDHNEFMTQAWIADPLTAVLARVKF